MEYRKGGSHARGEYRTPHGNSKAEAKGRSSYQNHCERVVKNIEERNVDMKWKSSKQGLASAEDLTINAPWGSHRSD